MRRGSGFRGTAGVVEAPGRPGGTSVHFTDRLFAGLRRVGNPVLMGIDPRAEDLPAGFLARFPADRAGVAEAFRAFARGLVDAVGGVVAAVKFQSAFYEMYGPEGVAALHDSVEYAAGRGLVVVLDGKRNDIGSTAEAYARAYLGRVAVGGRDEPTWKADALTINPYLGTDGVAPFVRVASEEGKGLFVLVKTSNPTAGEFQDLVADGRPVYRHVADRLAGWAEGHRGEAGYSLVGAVVGATYREQLAELRGALPGVPFLVPGYGAQGGSAADVAAAFDADGLGAVINSSRGLAFAYQRRDLQRYAPDWQRAVHEAARAMADDLAAHTPSSRLRPPA